MDNILLPAAIAVVVFVGFLLLLLQWISSDENIRKKAMLEQISLDAGKDEVKASNISLLKEQTVVMSKTGASGMFAKIPFVYSTFDMIVKAGLSKQRGAFLLGIYILFVVLMLAFRAMGMTVLGAALALFLSLLLGRNYLKSRIKRRVRKFLNMFPDATDMMVRSVRAGHPLSAALRMIAENMDNPIREEFKQIVDEVAYGRSLTESLMRMAHRIDSQDVHFFVVVLAVQQETGGSLAEVLTNLSGMLRKRKQLRLKINALTSEGRAASYILGALPCLEFAALEFMTPAYLHPLFATLAGNIILVFAIMLVIGAVWIIRKMSQIEI